MSLFPVLLLAANAATPVPFPYNTTPLEPARWPHHAAKVNRDRVFDFYGKQADFIRAAQPRPELVIPYPGLDGGKHGHWGNQNEEVWKDDRWNAMDTGPVMGGVLKLKDRRMEKAVCVHLGGPEKASVAFNPLTLRHEAVWTGGFLRYGSARSGLMDGITPAGDAKPRAEEPAAPAGARYLGYHRHGARVAFAWEQDGAVWLDVPAWKDGTFAPVRGPKETHPLRALTEPAAANWPQTITVKFQRGEGAPCAVDTIPLPFANPWKSLMYLGGHDFFANGDAAVCTIQGDVWLARGLGAGGDTVSWKRFAAGLHQPLGLRIVNDRVHVLGRDQITRLDDLNGDDEADFHACVSNAYDSSAGGHDYITGLERDDQGRWLFVSARQGFCRLSADGRAVETIASGFRNANGIGLAPDGTLTTSVQEGDWTPATMVMQMTTGGYYGYPGPKPDRPTLPPLLYLPRGVDNSGGGQTATPGSGWGPWRGELVHTSFGTGTAMILLRDGGGPETQALAVPLPGEFSSGAHRARFSPVDGHLYVTGMTGWGTYTVADGCFERLRFTGGAQPLPVSWQARDNGVLLRFDRPLDPAAAGEARRHVAQVWNYRHSKAYGSPEFSVRHPDTPGHDVLGVDSVHLREDGRALFLEIPQLRPVHALHLSVDTGHGRPLDLFATVHKVGPAVTDFPGYTAKAKESWAGAPVVAAAAVKANPWITGEPGRALRIEAAAGLTYSTPRLTARAGERISLTFANPDTMPHNWVLLRAGRLEAFTASAIRFITDPTAADRAYIPPGDDVIAHTDMLNAGQAQTIHFTLPGQPGEYPFLCTFPGHSQVMKGVLVVE